MFLMRAYESLRVDYSNKLRPPTLGGSGVVGHSCRVPTSGIQSSDYTNKPTQPWSLWIRTMQPLSRQSVNAIEAFFCSAGGNTGRGTTNSALATGCCAVIRFLRSLI